MGMSNFLKNTSLVCGSSKRTFSQKANDKRDYSKRNNPSDCKYEDNLQQLSLYYPVNHKNVSKQSFLFLHSVCDEKVKKIMSRLFFDSHCANYFLNSSYFIYLLIYNLINLFSKH